MRKLTTSVLVKLPEESHLSALYTPVHLADAYAITLPPDATTEPETLARFIAAERPAWVNALLWIRDRIVTSLSIKTSTDLRSAGGDRIDIFRVYERFSNEILLGEDDRHLDFRASVLVRRNHTLGVDEAQLVMSTVVQCHNVLGRIYLLLIAPFHRLVVRTGLNRAAKRGWPTVTNQDSQAVGPIR